MGASDSKLVFKQGIFKLSEERHIPADDAYWTSFWELPESAEDIFSLFAPADVRRTRDNALENLETLILAVTSRLFNLRHHPSFPDPEFAPELHALNCIRVLTRVLPYLYEKESLQPWEVRFFWGQRRKRTRTSSIANEILFDEAQEVRTRPTDEFEDARPLAEELIDTLIDLLFFSDLTVLKQPPGKPKVTYAIWQSGVGCNASIPTTKEHESNRCEILRLLLTLASQSMYMSPSLLPQNGTRALTHICSCPDKQVVLSTLKYNPASWRVPYNTLVFKDPKQILVTYTLQLLLVTLLYPIPEQPGVVTPKNFYRHFLGRLHRPQDFQFIVDGMTRILNQPLQANSSYIPGAQSSVKFAPEIIMLFWEITQCNKRFRSFMIDTDRAHDFVILILFYALEYKSDASKQGVVRMCAFLLQTLSVEKNFGLSLNKTFEAQDTLPPAIRIIGFKGSYADFVILSIYNLITTSQGKLTAIYPALLAVINNTSASLERLSGLTSSKIMQLFNSMSSPSFLMANETNHDLLRSLLEAMNSVIEHQYRNNPEFTYAILKNRKRFEALRSFTLESGQEEIERRNRRRKESSTSHDPLESNSTRSSVDSLRSPTTSLMRTPTLGDVPEEDDGTFAVGDDDDDSEDEERPTPAPSSPSEIPSRSSSVASQVSDDVPRQVRGMSEKARGKMPAGAHSFSRQNSTTSLSGNSVSGSQPGGAFEPSAHWIESWLPELPLHSILTLIQQLTALLPREAIASDVPRSATLHRIREIQLVGVDASAPRIQSFEWSPMALGWYESLLWGFIFSNEMQVSKGTVGIWNGTAIKLFRVQETAAQGPSLTSPRGAVDAVGSNIVSRIGQINLRGATTNTAPASGTGQNPRRNG
ncbi:high-temperature-induced dauer-formation protein-domain-containing protein [Bombardia bombarda]|uniref:High-temperature-induced dauer-formation protein-domain-containing protein n=1 Tax=Bombardia bombarda TaxID=252184 RepID=A0AA40CF71_9PEZI|nr:high-temperature-induced dauer-formation protein-domain-containing protein [Bombardia bombarda]